MEMEERATEWRHIDVAVLSITIFAVYRWTWMNLEKERARLIPFLE